MFSLYSLHHHHALFPVKKISPFPSTGSTDTLFPLLQLPLVMPVTALLTMIL